MTVTSLDAEPSAAPITSRDRVLDAAAERFVAQGYDATTLRQIAGDVGIKAGSIYHHFDSKDELFTAVLQQGIDVMVDAFDATAESVLDAEPRMRLAAHVRAHLGALLEHGPYTTNHVTAFFTAPPDVRREVVPVRDAYEARWTSLLDELQTAGAIAEGIDVGLTRLILFGSMNASVEWFDPERGTVDELAGAITEQCWSGVAA